MKALELRNLRLDVQGQQQEKGVSQPPIAPLLHTPRLQVTAPFRGLPSKAPALTT